MSTSRGGHRQLWMFLLPIVLLINSSATVHGQVNRPRRGHRRELTLNGIDLKKKKVCIGRPGCPIFIVDDQPYDVITLKPKGAALGVKVNGEEPSDSKAAISPDGKLLVVEVCPDFLTYAHTHPDSGFPVSSLEFWSVDTSKKMLEISTGVNKLEYLSFADNASLLVARPNQDVTVLDPQTGAPKYKIETGKLSLTGAALTPDGRYLAVKNQDGIFVYEVSSGKRVAQMEIPGTRSAPRRRLRIPGAVAAQNADIGQIPFLLDVDELEFSPNGAELAAYLKLSQRLVVWNPRGVVTFDQTLGVKSTMDQSIVWLPDSRGWLVGGQFIYLREEKEVVMTRPDQGFLKGIHRFLSRDKLLTSSTTDLGVQHCYLRFITLPWRSVERALSARRENDISGSSNSKAILKAGDSFRVTLNFGELKGEQPLDRISAACNWALEAAKMKSVSAGASFVLNVAYEEKNDREMKIREAQGPYDFVGKETGRTAMGLQADIQATITDSSETVVWKKEMHASSSRVYSGQINDETVRASLVDDAVRKIEAMQIPTFISNDPAVDSLPINLPE